jgi:ketosteroid isomerase-like protein
MITSNLRINQLSAAAYKGYLRYLTVLDTKDVVAYAAFLADDVSIQFGNALAVTGKQAVVGMLGGYWQSFKSIEHDLTNIYGTDKAYVLEALNHYERHDGKKVTIRAVAFTDKNKDGLVTSVRIFGDTSPLFEG